MNCDVGGAHIEVTLDPNPIDHGLAPEWDTIGVITKSAKNELTVDTCAPNSGCSPSFTKVSIQAPGLEVLFPLGAFVRLHVATSTYNNGLHATTKLALNQPATLMLGGQSWNVQVLRAYESYNLDRENAFSWYAASIE